MERKEALSWRKSTFSGANGGQCTEVASDGEKIHVRDTKQGRRGPVLSFTASAWRSFVADVSGLPLTAGVRSELR